jgi:hypothetical protein
MCSRKDLIAWLFSGLLILAALIFGYLSLRGLNSAVVVVEWSTASEIDTAGFNLYRAQSPEGPYTQINSDLIPSSSDPLTGDSYKYEDHQAKAGLVYYYQLEGVEYNGTNSRFGPIEVKATSGGQAEAILAVAFAFVGVLGFIFIRR